MVKSLKNMATLSLNDKSQYWSVSI